MSTPAPPHANPWREPLVWMIVGIPALTVVAGIVTFWIAAQRADSNVAVDYYKRGLTVNLALEREQRAAQMAVSATIAVSSGEMVVSVYGRLPSAPESVMVTLTHPVRAERDLRLLLPRSADGSYRTAMPALDGDRWQMSIEGADWRLRSHRVSMQPGARFSVPGAE
jgi:uncharacterized protein